MRQLALPYAIPVSFHTVGGGVLDAPPFARGNPFQPVPTIISRYIIPRLCPICKPCKIPVDKTCQLVYHVVNR